MAARRALTSSAHWAPVPVTNGPDEAHGSDRSDAVGFVVVGRRQVSSDGPAALWGKLDRQALRRRGTLW